MKRLHFDYCMEIRYSKDVSWCCYTIKCIPSNSERQKISKQKIEMIPETRPEWAIDSHGNRYIFGSNDKPHSYFKFHISGDAECGLANYECKSNECEEMIYRHSHGLTVAGDNIKSFYKKTVANHSEFNDCTPYEKCQILMEELQTVYKYEKGVTDVSTGAEEAFSNGKGVCQDYAHILISLLNLAGCSARYVTGLIIGEGESHAWVEVASDGKWYGVDPTNNTRVSDSHIKIGVGRDATECQINRGIMHGGGDQTVDVSVSVAEISFGENFLWKGAMLL